jgi:uncharacterized membrane protein
MMAFMRKITDLFRNDSPFWTALIATGFGSALTQALGGRLLWWITVVILAISLVLRCRHYNEVWRTDKEKP